MSIIEYSKEGRIAIFRINRPEAMGALNVEGMTQLNDTLMDFRDDDGLWAVSYTHLTLPTTPYV